EACGETAPALRGRAAVAQKMPAIEACFLASHWLPMVLLLPMLKVFVPKERGAGEARVALTPAAVKALAKRKVEIRVEAGAGIRANLADAEYVEAGATILDGNDADLAAAWSDASVVLTVSPPATADAA